jgi:hypothetical protein
VIGPLFVANIAGKTLRHIKLLSEAERTAISHQPSADGPELTADD